MKKDPKDDLEDRSDSDGSEEEDQKKGAFAANLDLLKRNPDLLKVLIAAGIQQGSANLANTFVISDMKATFWGEHMSEYQSLASILINLVAVVFGGPFGRFSDVVDRRVACAMFAAGTFMSGWALAIFGQTEHALWISTAMQIIGSFGLSTNVMFTLANDVTDAEDREIMAGLYFAFLCLMNVVLIAIPVLFILVLKIVPSNPTLIVWLQTGLTIFFFVILYAVKLGDPKKELDHDNEQWHLDSGQAEEDIDIREEVELPAQKDYKNGLWGLVKGFFQPFILACGHRRLRRLCIASFLLAFAGNLVSDIGGQFFLQSLGLLKHHDSHAIVMVSVLSMLPGQIMAIPGNLLTGYLAQQSGPLKLLRRLVPLAAFLVSVGGLMAVVRQMWYIAVVVICLTYANLPNVPLQRIVAGVAPPGRTGEAIGTVGVFSMMASLVGNLAVASINPYLLSSSLSNPLWVYYPSCGFMVLLALIPLLGTPRGGWGTASGKAVDSVHALIGARMAASKWKLHVAKNRRTAGKKLSSGQLRDLQVYDERRAHEDESGSE
eukprot:TRINITY_DN61591_c0_g1_i1.p1 TRINITY_DN61591_c0_g1~~TRINITY_DN61591_c0_g1_i1.p1  ORF type:complete len:547 (-),score=107.39 TRINITY_DN61591_c0_g1_i1:61-1701(-)